LTKLGQIAISTTIRDMFGWKTDARLDVMITASAVKSAALKEISPCCARSAGLSRKIF